MSIADEHHIVISADSHCGAEVRDYRPYLESKFHRDFDKWATYIEEEKVRAEAAFSSQAGSIANIGVGGDPVADADRNYSSERRLREMEQDGVIAAVLFPNTQPPFAPPSATQFEAPPYGDDMVMRWAGLRAHNRWLKDLVDEAPQRRAGVMQIFLGDVEGSVKEIEWAAENGLRGGVLVPGAPPDSPFDPLYSAKYEPIWAAAEAHNMPLNHHAGGATPSFGQHFPVSLAMYMLEVSWWSHRALWHLMFAGVFERHPNLKFVNTETGTAWIVDTLASLDSFYDRMKGGGFGPEAIFGGMAVKDMSLRPSEYWARQCYIGASFLRPVEAVQLEGIGIDNVMWGNDYPHLEGSFPYTSEHLRLTFSSLTMEQSTKVLTTNVADVYNFDVEALAPLAAKHCMTKGAVAQPISYDDIVDDAKSCPAMAPHTQLEGVS